MNINLCMVVLGAGGLSALTIPMAQAQINFKVGSIIEQTMPEGGFRRLKVIATELDPLDSTQSTVLHTVLSRPMGSYNWSPLCQPDHQGRIQAIALEGQWDTTGAYADNGEVTFTCTNGVLAKCVRLGYRPWQFTPQGLSLRPYHQACTRMIRADYCGDGQSYTQDGTLINIYDRIGIQTPDAHPSMTFEAAWGPRGAVLVNHPRFAADWRSIQQHCGDRIKRYIGNPYEPEEILKQAPAALIFNDSLEASHAETWP